MFLTAAKEILVREIHFPSRVVLDDAVVFTKMEKCPGEKQPINKKMKVDDETVLTTGIFIDLVLIG